MLVTLHRFSEDLNATYGVLTIDKTPQCLTLELPYRNNERNISCIPVGLYDVTKYNSPKHGNCFWVHGVPGRTSILMHSGNFPRDTQGCILVGENFVAGSVRASRSALYNLNGRLPHKFHLEIR